MVCKDNHRSVLQSIYDSALKVVDSFDGVCSLDPDVRERIELIIGRSEANKGIYTVLMTLFSHKIIDPGQDIRKHQYQIDGGFAGRVKDTVRYSISPVRRLSCNVGIRMAYKKFGASASV